ncbi:MAG: hypothetical protein AAF411_03550 [Myxococcota bacterium]
MRKKSACGMLRAVFIRWLLTCTACVHFSAIAAAQFATAHLQWEDDSPECPPASALMNGVETALARTVFTRAEEADLIVNGRFAREDDERVARFEVNRRDGERVGDREVRSARGCAALAEPLSLVLALVLDVPRAEVAAEEVQEPLAPEPERASEAPAPPSSTPIRLPALERSRPIWGEIDLGAGISAGMTPNPSAAFALAGGVRIGWASIRASAFVTHRSTVRADDGGADLVLAGAGGAACLGRAKRWSFDGCLEAHWRRAYGRGFGFNVARRTRGDYLLVGVGARWDVALVGPLRVFAYPRLLVATRRVRAVVVEPGGSEQLFRASPVALELLAGLTVRVGR